MKRRVVLALPVSAAVLAAGIGVSTVADAAGPALNPGSTTGTSQGVSATSAGMPVTAQVRWAVVNANGTKARSFPTSVTVIHDGVGVNRVQFPGAVGGCAFTGSIGLSGNVGVEAPGTIEVVTANASASQVFVTTRDLSGALADRGFHLSILC